MSTPNTKALPAVPELPVVVVGAGLGGACVALAISRTRPVVVLDAVGPAAGASGAAAGLVNAFTGRRAGRAWRADEARAALDRLGDASGVAVTPSGVLRPASEPKQAAAFERAAEAWPDEAVWVRADAATERWPGARAPHGALWIAGGGNVSVPALVRGALAAAERGGAEMRWGVRLGGWRVDRDAVRTTTDRGEIRASALVLCPGADPLPGLDRFAFGRVRGQTVTLDARLPAGFPAVAGGTYVVPTDAGVVVGATYEHAFTDLAVDAAASLALREKAARLVPALAEAPVVSARVGVRLTVPASVSAERLPRVGEVAPGVWLFAGFGSRGLLTAPLLAEALPEWLLDPARVPAELRPVAG